MFPRNNYSVFFLNALNVVRYFCSLCHTEHNCLDENTDHVDTLVNMVSEYNDLCFIIYTTVAFAEVVV